MNKIPFFTLSRQPEELKTRIKVEFSKIVDSGEFSCSKQVLSFEQRYAEFEGAKYCVLLDSGTSAILIAFQYYKDKINKTNTVYLPSQSFFATASSPYYLGFNLDFVDIGDDCNLDVEKLVEKNIKKNPLFLPVGLYGSPPDLGFLRDNYNDSFIICDGCQMHGSLIGGKHPINYCDILVLSYYASKNLGAPCESGALLTNNPEIYEYALAFRNHGRLKNDYNSHFMMGLNFRPSELVASALNIKLDYLESWTNRRIEIANFYRNSLISVADRIRMPKLKVENKNVNHLFPCFVKNRDKVREELNKRGIGTGNQYPVPLYAHDAWKGKFLGNYPVAERMANEVLTLACFPELQNDEMTSIIENLTEIV